MPKVRSTKRFDKQFVKLPATIQSKVKKQLALLMESPQHPSLGTKKMVNSKFWECRVDYHYRIVFKWQKETIIILLFVGTHQIYRKAA
jgi:mRNA-degrading endonuclease RelE of RelBE toxin-antitoxin system